MVRADDHQMGVSARRTLWRASGHPSMVVFTQARMGRAMPGNNDWYFA
jgi:hypothetical protein